MNDKTKTSKNRYSDPQLRDRLKAKLKQSDKGGMAGQCSARKSQLLATEYKKAGGGYTTGKSSEQKSLDQWTGEDWQTKSGAKKARSKKNTSRYLPKEAWEGLSDEEKQATDERKRLGSKHGKQYMSNTASAKKARKKVSSTKKPATKKRLKSSKKGAAKKRKASAPEKTGKSSKKSFKRGEHVEWTKIGGSTTGKVVRKITRDTHVHGHQVRASREHPQYEVATDATGKRAAHRPDKMKKA